MLLAKVQHAPRSSSEAWPRNGVMLGVLFAGITGFAAVAALVHRGEVPAIDQAITVRLQSIREPWFERLMVIVSWFGFPPQSRVLPPTYAAVLWFARFRLEAVFQLAAWGTALLSTIVKAFMRRPRPLAGTDLRVTAASLRGSSLPSGHVLTYVGVYGWMAIMANLLIQPRALRRLVVGALVSLIALIGPSRIYLGHHWPTDVAASYLLGSSYLATLALAYQRIKPRRWPR